MKSAEETLLPTVPTERTEERPISVTPVRQVKETPILPTEPSRHESEYDVTLTTQTTYDFTHSVMTSFSRIVFFPYLLSRWSGWLPLPNSTLGSFP